MLLGKVEPLVLLVAVLAFPVVSTGAAIAFVAARLLIFAGNPILHGRFAWRIALLALFAVSHFAIWLSYGFGEFDTAWKAVLFIVGLYTAGFAAGEESPGEVRALWATLAVVGGLVAFAALSVAASGELGSITGIAERAVPSVWGGKEVINAPGLGAFCSLGMCLAPAAVLSTPSRGLSKRSLWALRLLALALAAAGTYGNLALQNRTPVLAFAGAFAAGILVVGASGRRGGWLTVLLFLGAACLVAYVLAADNEIVARLGLYGRFRQSGLQTERYAAWSAMAHGLWSHLEGGRKVNLGGLRYAHNLWLDIARDTGVLPVALLLAFHVSHLGSIARLLRSRDTSFLSVALLGLGVSCLSTLAVEPTLQFSVVYFAVTNFLLGLLLRRDTTTRPGPVERVRANSAQRRTVGC